MLCFGVGVAAVEQLPSCCSWELCQESALVQELLLLCLPRHHQA